MTTILALDSTDERNPHDPAYQADQAAQAVEDAVFEVVAGDVPPEHVLKRVGILADKQSVVLDGTERAQKPTRWYRAGLKRSPGRRRGAASPETRRTR